MRKYGRHTRKQIHQTWLQRRLDKTCEWAPSVCISLLMWEKMQLKAVRRRERGLCPAHSLCLSVISPSLGVSPQRSALISSQARTRPAGGSSWRRNEVKTGRSMFLLRSIWACVFDMGPTPKTLECCSVSGINILELLLRYNHFCSESEFQG